MTRHVAQSSSRSRGYSLVEVLVVIVITTVGFLALINLQVGTVKGIGHTKSMMEAVNLAEHFIETLKSEAVLWTGSAVQLSNPVRFPYLHKAGTEGTTEWVPAFDPPTVEKRVGPLGSNLNWDSGVAQEIAFTMNRRYCVHYRFSWLVPDNLVRADVRVMWLKEDADVSLYQACEVGMEADFANVASVTIPGTIMRNVFFAQGQ